MPAPAFRRALATDHIISTVVDGEAVLLDLGRGVYFSLDPVATRLWEHLQRYGEVETAIDVMAKEYEPEVDRDVVARDVYAFLADLERRHFLGSRGQPSPCRPPLRPRRVLRLLKRASRLPVRHGYALIVTMASAAVVEAGLRVMALPRLARALGVPLSSSPPDGEPPSSDPSVLTPPQQRRVWATDVVYRNWPFGDTCLRRALVLGRVLREEQPVLRIGVTRDEGVLAHAWVETSRLSIGAQRAYTPLTQPAP